jgi:hypothetical protein
MNIKYDTSTRKSSSEVKRYSNEFSESYESKVINDAIVTEYGYIKDKFRAYLTYSDKNNTCESIDEKDKNKFFLSLKLR